MRYSAISLSPVSQISTDIYEALVTLPNPAVIYAYLKLPFFRTFSPVFGVFVRLSRSFSLFFPDEERGKRTLGEYVEEGS